jgi:hypothetical protein
LFGSSGVVHAIARSNATTAGLFKDPRGSLPVVWVTSRLGNAKWPKAMFTGEDEPFARRARVS